MTATTWDRRRNIKERNELMKMQVKMFRSKVSRRVVILFVLCALLPLSVLAVISFYDVSSQLRAESQKQLAAASKNQGMEIYERLEMLDSDLQIVALRWKENRTLKVDSVLGDHFSRMSVFSAEGRELEHWGGAMETPALSEAEKNHLASGNPLMKIGACADPQLHCVRMLRAVGTYPAQSVVLEAELNAQDLWPMQDIQVEQQLTVLADTKTVLFASGGSESAIEGLPVLHHSSGFVQWSEGGTKYDAAYWKLLVKPKFLESPWTIVVSQDHAQVMAPMLQFRRSFPLVMLLAFWVVLLFSAMQVRQTLGPLGELEKGTREIGAQRFESRVEVHSGDEFESLADSFNSMAVRLGRQFDTLKAINEVNQAIYASLDGEAIVEGMLAHMPRLISSEWFGVSVFDDSRTSGRTRFRKKDAEQVMTETVGLNATDWLELQNNSEGFVVGAGQRSPEYVVPMKRMGAGYFMILPIRVENSIRAALICGTSGSGIGDAIEQMQEARQVADHLAVALSHVRLIKALEQLQFGTLTALARAIDAKSDWTAGHSERVTHVAVEIAKKMGLSARDLQIIQMGGLLHDVGKIGTPPEILDKPGKLTAEEMRVMQDHVRIGVRILEPIPGLQEALPLVAEHHEWFNGKGYPNGVAGEEISLYARILAVADCYDALTSDRPYRKGMPMLEVLAMLQQKSGIQFDPQVIVAFGQVFAEKMAAKSMGASAG
jgi:putative nucleotidyltransferase with HDIG domain